MFASPITLTQNGLACSPTSDFTRRVPHVPLFRTFFFFTSLPLLPFPHGLYQKLKQQDRHSAAIMKYVLVSGGVISGVGKGIIGMWETCGRKKRRGNEMDNPNASRTND